MIKAPTPLNEVERLSSLYEYDLLDTMPVAELDNITQIASEICRAPMALIGLIDKNRQFYKSKVGIDGTEAAREYTFCGHALMSPDQMMVVPDSSKDERFFDNPHVVGDPHVGFYAGVPLVNEAGYALGTLCVIDTRPKDITDEQKDTLQALARQVVASFELHKKNIELNKKKRELEILNEELDRFAYVAAHDLKSPCNNMRMLTGLLKDNYAEELDEEGNWVVQSIESSASLMAGLVDGILQHTKAINTPEVEKVKFDFGQLIRDIEQVIQMPAGFTLTYEANPEELYTARAVLQQILINLIVNAIKYNDKEHGHIFVEVGEDNANYLFSVTDNGPGIAPSQHESIFDLFSTLGTDNQGRKGHGIGLATVKRLVERLDGSITVDSEKGKGSTFRFSLQK